MKTKSQLYLVVVLAISVCSFGQGDIFVNRIYQEDTGNPVFNPILNQFGIQYSKSILSSGGEIITVGHTAVAGEGENIMLEKRDPDGNIIFNVNHNTFGSDNDYGISVFEAVNGDIYVCGTTDKGGLGTNFDAVVLRYNATGNLVGSTTYTGPDGLNDIGTALIIHPTSKNLIVAVCNENSSTGYDFLALELNPISLAALNSNLYDYAALTDIPLGVEIDSSTGDILIIGGSQSSTITCAYVVAVFDGTSLAYVSDSRTDLVGSPNDQATAYAKDAAGNIYITGKSLSATSFNVKTAKILPNYSIAWTATLDLHGLDDLGSSVACDPVTGDVIVGGYATKTNNLKEMICLRYNNSGTLLSTHAQSAENTAGDAAIRKLVTNSMGDVYFIGGEHGYTGLSQVVVGKLRPDGEIVWQRKIRNPVNDLVPSDIEAVANGCHVISVEDSVTDSYLITGYSELETDSARTFVNGTPIWKTRELLVSFMPSVVNKAFIDSEVATGKIEFGPLSDFLSTNAVAQITNALQEICRDCEINAIKVHDGMKTTDTVAISRLGQYVKVPAFWATFLLQFPVGVNIQQAQGILNSLQSIVVSSQPNNFVDIMSPPNDSLYNLQKSLHPVGSITNAHINVEEAWDISQSCGSAFVKGGIFDSGVMYKHEDFGYNGSPSSGKVEGWIFKSGYYGGGMDLKQTSVGLSPGEYDGLGGHGTQVAGIIGALRNNTIGISGIAGGDAANNNPGITLYSLNTLGSKKEEMYRLVSALLATSLGDGSTPYAYPIHFSNHSYKANGGWGNQDSVPIYLEQIRFANRMQVTIIAARGNYSTNDNTLPATYDSCMVISVGASDSTGTKSAKSCFGSGMDIIAPGDINIVRSTAMTGGYTNFSGTSAAAPFASGVVGLLMSYLNDSINNYKNLAPEDCDFIIRHTATDVGPAGYDSINAYGRLNAGKALRMVEKPVRTLHHYGTNSYFPHTISKSIYSNNDTVILTETYKNYSNPPIVFPKARYVVNTYQIDATVSHIYTYPTDSMMYKWPRHSSSYVYPLPDAQKKLNMHERVAFTSFSSSGASLRGFVYQVWDTVGNFKGWWPCDTSFNALFNGTNRSKTLMEYSVLYKNKAVGIAEFERQKKILNVFPNPSSASQTIVVENDKISFCTVEMYDLMGRHVKTVYQGKVGIGKTEIPVTLEGLPNSMYFYLMVLDDKRLSIKVIKGE